MAYEEEYHDLKKKINDLVVSFSLNNDWDQNLMRLDKKMSESDLNGERKALVTILITLK